LNSIDEPIELETSTESMEAGESEQSLNSIDEPIELETSTESTEDDEGEQSLNSVDEPMEISFDLQENAEFVESVHLMMSDQFHTIVHSGLSARINCLILRFYENAANFSPYTHGMIRFIDWTTEMAERFSFDSLFQAALATELFILTWDDVFAKSQTPGIVDRQTNRDAWQKIIDMSEDEHYSYCKFVYDAVSSALFNRKYEPYKLD